MPIYYDPGKKEPPPKPKDSPAARVSFGVPYKPVIGAGGYQAGPKTPEFNMSAVPKWLQNFMYQPNKPVETSVPGYGKPLQVGQPVRYALGAPLQSAFLLGDWFNRNNRTASLSQYSPQATTAGGPWNYPAALGGGSYMGGPAGTPAPKAETAPDPNYGRGRGTNRRDRPDWAGNYDYSQSQMGYGGIHVDTLGAPLPNNFAVNKPATSYTPGGYPGYYGWGGGGGGGGYSYSYSQPKKSWYSDLVNWRI